jgi:hypothetical protein
MIPARLTGDDGRFIFGAISAASILLVTVGVFNALIKLGRFLDVLKDKA